MYLLAHSIGALALLAHGIGTYGVLSHCIGIHRILIHGIRVAKEVSSSHWLGMLSISNGLFTSALGACLRVYNLEHYLRWSSYPP